MSASFAFVFWSMINMCITRPSYRWESKNVFHSWFIVRLFCTSSTPPFATHKIRTSLATNSVAARFGQHGMPPPTSNPDLWPFDLETGMRIASKVWNFPSRFGHTRPLGSLIISYVCNGRMDGRTDRWTDGQTKAMLIAPSLQAGAIISVREFSWV